MTPEIKSFVVQARARIIWGERPADVKTWLIENGLPADTAQLVIEKSREEYAVEIRRIGVRGIVIGTLCILAGIAPIALMFFSNDPKAVAPYVWNRIGAAGVAAMLYGVWRIANGVFRLLFGSKTRESIPDIAS